MRRSPFPRARTTIAGLLLGLLLAALSACGGNERTPVSLDGGTRPPTAGPSATTPAPGRTATSRPSIRPTGGSTARPTGKATAALPGRLDRTCVRKGNDADVQGITVTTDPGGPVGYTTIYSDGSSQVDADRGYKTGGGGGFAESDGTFRQTWVVPPQAPLGKATVRVIDSNRTFDLFFDIVAATSTCP